MADSKRKKEVKQKEVPKGKIIAQGGDPERYYYDLNIQSREFSFKNPPGCSAPRSGSALPDYR